MDKKTIKQISTATENAIRRKGAVSLPDRPSDENMSASDIKEALFAPVLDVTNSAITEIKRVINESNEVTDDLYSKAAEVVQVQSQVDDIKENIQINNANIDSQISELNTRMTELENKPLGNAENAKYAQFALGDNSGKTIAERLDALGFREGTLEWRDESVKTLFLNPSALKFTREGNRVFLSGTINFSSIEDFISVARGNLGLVPKEFEYNGLPGEYDSLKLNYMQGPAIRLTSSSNPEETTMSFEIFKNPYYPDRQLLRLSISETNSDYKLQYSAPSTSLHIGYVGKALS